METKLLLLMYHGYRNFLWKKSLLIARLVQLGVDDLQMHSTEPFYHVKASVEFFSHRGQMCFSVDHDMSECTCDFQAGRRPIWMPPPEVIET